jgi:ribosomal protein L37E
MENNPQTSVGARPSEKYTTTCEKCSRAAIYVGNDLPSYCSFHESERIRKENALTPKELFIVKSKIEGELNDIPQAEIAKKIYPNAKPASAGVMMSQELNKLNVKEALQIALERRGLSVDKIIGVVDDALAATKPNPKPEPEPDPVTGERKPWSENVPDHGIRLKAAGMVSRFLGIDKADTTNTNYNFINMSQDQKEKYGL